MRAGHLCLCDSALRLTGSRWQSATILPGEMQQRPEVSLSSHREPLAGYRTHHTVGVAVVYRVLRGPNREVRDPKPRLLFRHPSLRADYTMCSHFSAIQRTVVPCVLRTAHAPYLHCIDIEDCGGEACDRKVSRRIKRHASLRISHIALSQTFCIRSGAVALVSRPRAHLAARTLSSLDLSFRSQKHPDDPQGTVLHAPSQARSTRSLR